MNWAFETNQAIRNVFVLNDNLRCGDGLPANAPEFELDAATFSRRTGLKLGRVFGPKYAQV